MRSGKWRDRDCCHQCGRWDCRGHGPGSIIVPDQLIDYTWGRHSTFCGQSKRFVQHVDFSFPFDQALSDKLVSAVNTINDQSEAARPVMAEVFMA